MVNINYFKNFVDFVTNKVQIGNTITVSEFNTVVNQAQLQKFEIDYQTFIKTEEVSDYLKSFLKNKISTVPPSGEYSYPTDYQHTAAIRSYYVKPGGNSVEVPVEEVKNKFYGDIMRSKLFKPSAQFPKYSEFANNIRFLPKNIGIIMFDYFKTPVAPVWAFTTLNGRPVYDPVNSINFEWNEFAINEIAAIYLSLIGINLREGDLIQFSNMFKAETNSTL
jgi:hypothetical protein